MAKFDAEVFKKHHFWILLVVLAVPIILAIMGAFSVSDATETKLKDNLAKKAEIEGTKTQSKFTSEKLEEQKKRLYTSLGTIWQAAWNSQNGIFTWPQGLQQKHQDALKTLKFGTDLEALKRDRKFPDYDALKEQFHEQYVKEFQSLPEKIAPMQFNGGLDAIIKYVKKFPYPPNSEDIWLAMEDLWIQSIVVDTIDGVNKGMAKFEPVGEMNAANKLNRKFRSQLWEVDLQIGESEERRERFVKGKIKNITERLLPLGVTNQMILNVWLDSDPRSQPFAFVVEGEQIKAGEVVEIKRIPANMLRSGLRVDEFARVEQLFDLKTIPVKRIDKVEMGYKSNRQQPLALKMAPISDKAIADAAGPVDGAADSVPGSVAPGAIPGSEGRGGPGGADAGGNAANAFVSPCGLNRNRYIDVTPQVRRMPIGIVVICEQAYIQDVLLGLANTKLRFQITQDHFKRSRDLTAVTPQAVDPNGPGTPGVPPGPGALPPGLPGGLGAPPVNSGSSGGPGIIPSGPGRGKGSADGPGGGPGMIPGGSGMMPGGPGRGAPGSASAPGLDSTNAPAPEQTSNNLVELSVYGVASIYEKFSAEAEGEPVKADVPAKK